MEAQRVHEERQPPRKRQRPLDADSLQVARSQLQHVLPLIEAEGCVGEHHLAMLREVGAVDGVSHALHGGEAAEGEDGRLEPICGEGGSNGGRAFAGWGSDVQTHPADDRKMTSPRPCLRPLTAIRRRAFGARK